MLTHRQGEFFLDRAFALIEGHPAKNGSTRPSVSDCRNGISSTEYQRQLHSTEIGACERSRHIPRRFVHLLRVSCEHEEGRLAAAADSRKANSPRPPDLYCESAKIFR